MMGPQSRYMALLPQAPDAGQEMRMWEVGAENLHALDMHLSQFVVPDTLSDRPSISLLVPITSSPVRRISVNDMDIRQAITVARLDAERAALGPVYAVAVATQENGIMLACVDRNYIDTAVNMVEAQGFCIDAIIPAGAIIPAKPNMILRADIARDACIIAPDYSVPDEAALVDALFPTAKITPVSAADVHDATMAALRDPPLNFMTIMPQRRNRVPLFTAWQKRAVLWLACIAVVLAALGAVAYLARLHWAISQDNSTSISIAQSIDERIVDIETAERDLSAALKRKNIKTLGAETIIATVWKTVAMQENVGIQSLEVDQNAIVRVTIFAPDAQQINPVLLALQRSGFIITARARKDNTGMTLVDITVKAP